MEKKVKRIETVNLLPEPIIQHIQSFLDGKGAARTTLLSKPWYKAWSTRPTLDFDAHDFDNRSEFQEFTNKTMQRYIDLNLKIECFRLRTRSEDLAHSLIANAIKIGAIDLELDLPSFTFPREVFESECIVRLSLPHLCIEENNGLSRCPKLKSLSIHSWVFVLNDGIDTFRNIISSCCASIEELSLTLCVGFTFSLPMYPHELRKLRRLFLDSACVDNTFFSDCATRFPCLKDLSLINCSGHTRLDIASTLLERITLVQRKRSIAKFDVPNIRKFTYSGTFLPLLYIKASSTRRWEFDISIECFRDHAASWFLRLKRLLKRMSPLCRIKLSLVCRFIQSIKHDQFHKKKFEVVPKRVVVEDLRIEAPSEFRHVLMVRLLEICCITRFPSSVMNKKGKGVKTVNLLPEPIIQHIQSFLNCKEAARTTLLSKPWYNAWLTRPTLDFDEYNFYNLPPESSDFEEYTSNTMQWYQDLSLKIDCFRLRTHLYARRDIKLLAHSLIVNAIKIGATDLELNLPYLILPREVLESESIVRLSLTRGEIDHRCVVCCSGLKYLSMYSVTFESGDVFRDIISSCSTSIEELSLFLCKKFTFSRMSPYELQKLRRLFLNLVCVDNTFFSDFATRFPCLKDLSLVNCTGYTRIEMASTSLERITLAQLERGLIAKYDIPNIRKFTYSGTGLPSLSIKGSSTRKWEFDLSVDCFCVHAASWFLRLNMLLEKMSLLSRINLSIDLVLYFGQSIMHDEVDNDIQDVPKRVVVEDLTIKAPSELCSALVVRLFGICCPKFITHYWLPESPSCSTWQENNDILGVLCNVLTADQNMLGEFGLNEVKVELYEEIITDEWRLLVLKEPLDASKPPINKRKVRFQLRWG